jgi:WD40 repeat protein
MEVDLMNRRMIRKGKVWSNDYNNGKGYELTKIRSTASTLSSCPPHQQSRAITTSKLHNHVAVANNQGDIMIFMEDDFTNCIAKLKHPQEWVEAIEYSPDSRFLAVGAHDDTIYIYKISTDGKYSLHYKIEYMHSSAVTALDWSKDSKYLRAIDQAYAKMFYDITECVHIKDGASVLTDPAIWETSTCKLGWYSSGVFRAGMDGSDINAIDSNEDRSLVAVGDDSGTLCVYRYPVRAQHHDCVRLGGHSSHVSKVRFFENGNPEDARILTAGGYDRSYIQWRQGGLSEEPEEDDINQ